MTSDLWYSLKYKYSSESILEDIDLVCDHASFGHTGLMYKSKSVCILAVIEDLLDHIKNTLAFLKPLDSSWADLICSQADYIERDINLIKRKAKQGFANPIYRVYGQKSDLKHPDQLINFNKLVCVKKVGNYDKLINKWKNSSTRCSIVVQLGPNIMISDSDFFMLDKRSNRFDVTPIIEMSGSIDGTVLLNLNHVIHAYRRTYDGLMSKEKFAAAREG